MSLAALADSSFSRLPTSPTGQTPQQCLVGQCSARPAFAGGQHRDLQQDLHEGLIRAGEDGQGSTAIAPLWQLDGQVAPLMEKVKVAQATTDAAKLQLREAPRAMPPPPRPSTTCLQVEKRVEAVEAPTSLAFQGQKLCL